MKTCLSCANWKPRESGAIAKHGFAVCSLGARWTFLALHHSCQQHQAASAEVTEARIKWNERRRK
jgi:hypothetical protein